MNKAVNHLIEINQLTDERIDTTILALEKIVLSVNLDVDSIHAGDKHNLLILVKDTINIFKLIKKVPSDIIVEKLAELTMIVIKIPE